MRLIEIRNNKLVTIDGITLKLDFDLDKNIRAVFWDASVPNGFVEKIDGSGDVITSFEKFQHISDIFAKKIKSRTSTEFTFGIVVDDKKVRINDKWIRIDNMVIDENYHAVFWSGSEGFIETKAGSNISIVDLDEFTSIISAYNQQKADEDQAISERQAYEQTAEHKNIVATNNRQAAYIAEADPLFFKHQRGEATEQEWLDKVAEIKARYPKVGE